jgi:hypothetical protein
MMEYIGIIVGVVCVIALAVVGYFLYSRISTQQTTIEQLILRQRSMESAFFRPPPQQEINSLYSKRTTNDGCDDCVVKPFEIEIESPVPTADQDANPNLVGD